jgi:hypothetical protein
MEFVPEVRTDLERRDVDGEAIVWSPLAAEPTVLDPVATVMLDVMDGEASVAQLAQEVHEELGIPLDAAEQQLERVVGLFAAAKVLTVSGSPVIAERAIDEREIFIASSTECSENASRLGTEELNLQLGTQRIRVACDSRRGARALRSALSAHVSNEQERFPLGFVLTAPQGFQRRHSLTDRAGFELSAGRGLDSGLRALASHLTALLPPAPGTVRVGARAVECRGAVILCTFPLLYFPPMSERDLGEAGIRLVDRLGLDIDVSTGAMSNQDVPWPSLAALECGRAHGQPTGPTEIAAVVLAGGGVGAPPPTRATAAALLAARGVAGSPGDLLDAALRVVERAEVLSTPAEAAPFSELLMRVSADLP